MDMSHFLHTYWSSNNTQVEHRSTHRSSLYHSKACATAVSGHHFPRLCYCVTPGTPELYRLTGGRAAGT
jgi:hypothetical protein